MVPDNAWQGSALPFSFRLNGTVANPSQWPCQETTAPAPGGAVTRHRFSDPASGLVVTAERRSFDAFPAQEWILSLENAGDQPTPIIDELLALDACWDCASAASVVLHRAHGSQCVQDDFLPVDQVVSPGQTLCLAPEQGRSSDGVLPFMNLEFDHGGIVLAVGWTGQWAVRVERGPDAVRLTAGMQHCRLYLQPQETIRTPRILTIAWEGERSIVGNNLLRRLLLRHYYPRLEGRLAMPPVAHMTMSTYHHTGVVTPAGELEALNRIADLGGEAYWVDACWYGSGGRWWEEVGNWQVRPDQFPDGLGFIGAAAHARGMRFVLWFEPERVRRGTPIDRDHGEFLLRSPHDPDNALLNLGCPAARAYITDAVSAVITASGVDIYRQDFNFAPLPFWHAADPPGRRGITEIRHVQGLYAMWDELLQRHPGLAIDNCSSGGRRLDLETTRRSWPLWRSDFSDVGGPQYGRGLQLGDQSQTAGLSRWLPLHTAAVWSFDAYDFRSAMAAGVVLYCDIRRPEFPAAAAAQAIAELKRLRPYYLGDFYPLIPLTVAAHDWCAYQYHRPEEGDGFAVFLRRHESPYAVVEFSLQGIDPDSEYEIGATETFAPPTMERAMGSELTHLLAEINERPGSLLFQYRRV
jgi:alpha-galactosidase